MTLLLYITIILTIAIYCYCSLYSYSARFTNLHLHPLALHVHPLDDKLSGGCAKRKCVSLQPGARRPCTTQDMTPRGPVFVDECKYIYYTLVGGLEHQFYFPIYWE